MRVTRSAPSTSPRIHLEGNAQLLEDPSLQDLGPCLEHVPQEVHEGLGPLNSLLLAAYEGVSKLIPQRLQRGVVGFRVEGPSFRELLRSYAEDLGKEAGKSLLALYEAFKHVGEGLKNRLIWTNYSCVWLYEKIGSSGI
jgi:hypothetical protein